jgi:hypothetical protein
MVDAAIRPLVYLEKQRGLFASIRTPKGSIMFSTQVKSSAVAAPRRGRSRAVILGLATLAIGLLTVEAQAACRGGFCVTGSDNNGVHTVNFTTTLSGFTDFNVNTPQGQRELGANVRQFAFNNGASGQLESFALQACAKGGLFSHSKCTPWATFTHTPN